MWEAGECDACDRSIAVMGASRPAAASYKVCATCLWAHICAFVFVNVFVCIFVKHLEISIRRGKIVRSKYVTSQTCGIMRFFICSFQKNKIQCKQCKKYGHFVISV